MKLDIEFKESNSNFQSNFGELKVINGKSAYEIAVEEGFIGTIDEWLESLHGADGYTPLKGQDYFTESEIAEFKEAITPVKGIDYTDGADGYTPQKGTDYYTDEDKAEMLESVKSAFAPDVQTINQTAEQAMSIAKGRATGYVFDTLEDLETALTDEEFVANLVLGDNLYIRATDVPDYWWDGEQKQELETEKPDLSGFVKSDEVQTMIDNSLAAIGVAEEGVY